jgi:hypothetical protein
VVPVSGCEQSTHVCNWKEDWERECSIWNKMLKSYMFQSPYLFYVLACLKRNRWEKTKPEVHTVYKHLQSQPVHSWLVMILSLLL